MRVRFHCPDRGLVLALSFSCALPAWAVLRAAELDELIPEYEAAKREFQASRRQPSRPGPGGPGGGGGRGGRGGWGRQQRPPELEPLLTAIAKVNSEQSIAYLIREYGDPDAEVASRAGAALLESDHQKAVQIVTRGFEKGTAWTPGARVRILDALARAKDSEGPEFVIRTASRGNDAVRVLALGSLALRPEDEKARDALLAAVKDRAPAVRKAALRALKTFRSKAIIAPLIERVGKESDPQLRIDAAQLLVDLTGQNMGLVAEDWKKWWSGVESSFAVGAKQTGKTRVVAPKLAYFGIEVSSKRISFLIDASASMLEAPGEGGRGRGPWGGGGNRGKGGPDGEGAAVGGRKIDHLKTELTRILKELPEDTLVNIISFHAAPVPWKKELHSLKGAGRDEAIAYVRGLTTEFGTNIYDTLELALKDERVDTLYMLTDGEPAGGKYTAPADIIREISAINRLRSAKIHCIGFGLEANFLKELAEKNGGDFRLVDGTKPEKEPAAEKPKA